MAQHLSSDHDDKEVEEVGPANHSEGEVIFGDLIWVRPNGSSWWPAQVVDENTVSGSNKPGNRSVGEVLVRLYGSYNYLYVDPMKCHFEFKNILRQNNGSYSGILRKSLEEVRCRSKSGRKKGKGSRSKDKFNAVASDGEVLKQNRVMVKKIEASLQASTSFRGHRANKCISVTNNSKGDVSKARVFPRRQLADNTPQTKVGNGVVLSEADETLRNTSIHIVVKKKFKHDNLSGKKAMKIRSCEKNLARTISAKKLRPNDSSIEEISERKTPAKDGDKSKHARKSPRSEEAKCKMSKKKLKSSNTSLENEDCEGKTHRKKKLVPNNMLEGDRNNRPKKIGERNNLKQNSQRVEETKGKFYKKNLILVNLSADKGECKSKTRVKRKLVPNSSGIEEVVESKKLRKHEEQSILKQNSSGIEEVVESKKHRKHEEQSILKQNNSRVEGANSKIPKKKVKPFGSSTKKEECKTSKQDRVRKRLGVDSSCPKDNNAEGRNSNKAVVGTNLNSDHSCASEEAKCKTPKHDVQVTAPEDSQIMSARRMKVMQSLGLIAPSGSPFHRSGCML